MTIHDGAMDNIKGLLESEKKALRALLDGTCHYERTWRENSGEWKSEDVTGIHIAKTQTAISQYEHIIRVLEKEAST